MENKDSIAANQARIVSLWYVMIGMIGMIGWK
jgi:hypothetical protein